jgi:chromosome segregation ATPase
MEPEAIAQGGALAVILVSFVYIVRSIVDGNTAQNQAVVAAMERIAGQNAQIAQSIATLVESHKAMSDSLERITRKLCGLESALSAHDKQAGEIKVKTEAIAADINAQRSDIGAIRISVEKCGERK